MFIICPRCHSSSITRIQQAHTQSIGSQVGMASLGTQLAKHLPLPAPWGILAGGLIGSILGDTMIQQTQPPRIVFECNECQHQFI